MSGRSIAEAARGTPWFEGSSQGRSVKSYRFDSNQTFAEARRMLREINDPRNSGKIATLVWLEGNQAKQSMSFRWDPLAEHFGHQIDKEAIDREIVSALLCDIAVEVTVRGARAKASNE